METAKKKQARRLLVGLAFLTPNIIGFLTFTLFPLVFSFAMAFTNWDLTLHNIFKDAPVRFVGLDNFILLVTGEEFWHYFGNTLFLMISIPFSIAGSLLAAILLSKQLSGSSGRISVWILMVGILTTALIMLLLLGMGSSAMTILIVGCGCTIFVAGAAGGQTVYRTLFYTPHFTAGVATYILWKSLYNPQNGPINNSLTPLLEWLTGIYRSLPESMGTIGLLLCGAIALLIAWKCSRLLVHKYREEDAGLLTTCLGLATLSIPFWVIFFFAEKQWVQGVTVTGLLILTWFLFQALTHKPTEKVTLNKGFGSWILLSMVGLIGIFTLLGLSIVADNLPALARQEDGLTPPEWLANYYWAKPALIIMSLWAAIGSNQMILYLAGLTNVPQELYEAADIDGAAGWQKFWNVTWPQLAPITFFIVVMAVIHGLQGGFEMARTMTRGGPAGATTTLSYFVYSEGFETGRLGFASAVAWALFLLVFIITMINVRFGNRYVND